MTKTLLPLATGTRQYDEEAKEIRARLHSQLPRELILPKAFLDNLPLDVTEIPITCGLLSDQELAITKLDATGVRDLVAAGEITAVQSVTAFGKRAAIAQQLVCCLTDYFLEDAIKEAEELDKFYHKNGRVVGPLHGVPISFKDHISVKGRYSSNGFKAGISLSDHDADLVQLVRKLGAIPYVKTNMPQTIMHLESHSVYGRVLNPYNLNLTPGGSTGGEAALIALKGSCLGIGTDGGGSIRNPAGNTGIYGLRPTGKTVPMGGYRFYMEGADAFGISTGPMCSSARDIELFMRVVCATKPHLQDPTLNRLSWEAPEWPEKRKLRVGIMIHDGVVLPHPPMLRGIKYAAARLASSKNIELVTYEPFKQRLGYDNLRQLYFEDGGREIKEWMEKGGEDPLALTEWLLKTPLTSQHTVQEGWQVRKVRDQYRVDHAAHWNASGIDVLLCPPFPGTACPHDTARYWGYTAVYNNVDYPGIVFPLGIHADPLIDVKQKRSNYMDAADKYNDEIYEPTLYEGAPIGLQLLAYRGEDAKLLSSLHLIQTVLNSPH